MTHFTVLVTGDDVEGQLAPFDEGIDMGPYKRYIDVDSWWWLRDQDGVDRTDLVALAEAYNSTEEGGDEAVGVDEDGLYEWSRYNPDSKWDWWVVGGRWTGYFDLRPGETGTNGEPGVMTDANSDPTKCDSARKGAIDIDAMRRRAGDDAAAEYDKFTDIVAKHGPLPSDSWRELRDTDRAEFDRLKAEYWEHPTIKALKDLLGMFSMPSEVFGVSRDEYIAHARLGAVPGYAMLHEGEWIEPGQMGWFGMSTETQASKLDYLKRANDIIDSLPDDTVLTVVDCHI